MNLINQMKLSMDAMTLGEKFTGSIVVTLLGVGIVFAALIVLFFTIVAMEKIIVKPKPKKEVVPEPVNVIEEEDEDKEEVIEDTELVAVITAAIASSLNTSTHNLIVRNITRVEDTTPSWAKAGRMDQITNN